MKKKSRKQFIRFYTLLYLGLIALSVFFLRLKGITNLNHVYVVNISVDIFGMLVGYVLFNSYFIDVQKTGHDSRFFLYILNTTFMALLTDLGAWLLEGEPDLVRLNLADNTVYYMCMPIACFFFWHYLRSFFKINSRITTMIEKIMFIGLILALAAIVLNVFTGFYFTIDPAGFYVRSKWYILSLIYAFATSVLSGVIIVIYRKKLELHQMISLLLFVFIPTGAGLSTMAVKGLSVSYGAVMIIILMIYCFLNIEQGRQKALVDRDLELAKSIQTDSLPNVFPAFPEKTEFDIYASMDPAKAVGGDFYDFYLIDDDHLCLIIADVSGKGIPAALFMMSAKTILHNNALSSYSPAKILEKTNEAICRSNKEGMFVTVWIGILEISSGRLKAANAGHEFPMIKKAEGRFELLKDKHDLVIGVMEGMKYNDYELQLESGAKIFVYTDGLPEATDRFDQMFTTDRVVESLNKYKEKSPRNILEGISKDVNVFVDGAPQFDDLTMLCLEIK